MNFWAFLEIFSAYLAVVAEVGGPGRVFRKKGREFVEERLCTKSLPALVLAQPFKIHPHINKQMPKNKKGQECMRVKFTDLLKVKQMICLFWINLTTGNPSWTTDWKEKKISQNNV